MCESAVLSILETPSYIHETASFIYLVGERSGVTFELVLSKTSKPINRLIHLRQFAGGGYTFNVGRRYN